MNIIHRPSHSQSLVGVSDFQFVCLSPRFHVFPPSVVMMGEQSELDAQWSASCLKALDGFLMILSQDGDVVYTSETVSKCLGISQVTLTHTE